MHARSAEKWRHHAYQYDNRSQTTRKQRSMIHLGAGVDCDCSWLQFSGSLGRGVRISGSATGSKGATSPSIGRRRTSARRQTMSSAQQEHSSTPPPLDEVDNPAVSMQQYWEAQRAAARERAMAANSSAGTPSEARSMQHQSGMHAKAGRNTSGQSSGKLSQDDNLRRLQAERSEGSVKGTALKVRGHANADDWEGGFTEVGVRRGDSAGQAGGRKSKRR